MQYFNNTRDDIIQKHKENRDHNWDCKVTEELVERMAKWKPLKGSLARATSGSSQGFHWFLRDISRNTVTKSADGTPLGHNHQCEE